MFRYIAVLESTVRKRYKTEIKQIVSFMHRLLTAIVLCVCIISDHIIYYFFIAHSCYSKACKLPSVAGAVVVVEIVKETSIYVGNNLVLMAALKYKATENLRRRNNDKEIMSNASAPPAVPNAIYFNVFDPSVVTARNYRHFFSVCQS